jgi:hypothetical protein
MGNRACPLCFAKLPRSLVLTRSEDLACPSCHALLELSRSSRVLSAFVGRIRDGPNRARRNYGRQMGSDDNRGGAGVRVCIGIVALFRF